jgi:predicted nucleotidyltransferase component of viral defense system
MPDFLHNDPEFKELLSIVSFEKGIDISLVEKDYWIMHALYGLNKQGIEFELKGGTSLSKGFGLINRFSEDIDIHIKTNYGLEIEGKEDKPNVKEARKFRSGGIRLHFTTYTAALAGIKDGILLEVGFDTVSPNRPIDISSWVLD